MIVQLAVHGMYAAMPAAELRLQLTRTHSFVLGVFPEPALLDLRCQVVRFAGLAECLTMNVRMSHHECPSPPEPAALSHLTAWWPELRMHVSPWQVTQRNTLLTQCDR